jgi:MFS family permease
MNGILNQWWRIGGLLGIGFVVLFLIGGIAFQGETPTYDDPIDEIRAYWEDDGNTYLLGDYLIGLAFLFGWVPLIVSLRALLGRAEGEPHLWSRVAFVGGVITLVFGAVAGLSTGALAFGAENIDDASMQTLMYISLYGFNNLAFAAGLFMLAASLVIWQTGALWRWTGVLGAIAGLLAVISPLGILDDNSDDIFDLLGFFGFIGLALWVLAISVCMLLKQEEPVAAARREM